MTSLVYREISCRKAVDGDNFARGVQDFDFSTGHPTAWLASKTFFRVSMTITARAGVQPTIKDQVAFAENAPACLYDNCYFRGGGQDISSIVNYSPQASAVKTRLSKSGAWLNNIGESAFLQEADFQKRVAKTATGVSGTKLAEYQQIINVGAATHYHDATIAITLTTGVVVGVNTTLDTLGIEVGDILVVNGNEYTISVAPTTALGGLMAVTATSDITAVVATTDAYVKKARDVGNSRNVIYAMYQPPIGIFDHEVPMGSGDFRFQLNPNSNYKLSAIQTSLGVPTVGGGAADSYDLVINDVKLYIATIQMSIPNQVETLHLNEMQIQSKPGVTGTNSFNFTVPPSTSAVSIFVQGTIAGSSAVIPPTLFVTTDGTQNSLTQIQATYANLTKPATNWASLFNGTTNQTQHRYLETLQESGLIENSGGAESLSEYLMRGPIYHYSFLRDKDDLSTQLQLQMTFSALTNANVFVCAHYRRAVRITTNNGQIVEVMSLAR